MELWVVAVGPYELKQVHQPAVEQCFKSSGQIGKRLGHLTYTGGFEARVHDDGTAVTDGGQQALSEGRARIAIPFVQELLVAEVTVIVNTPEGDQILLTTLDRNDHIIGMLSVATLNWHSSKIASQNYIEEEE